MSDDEKYLFHVTMVTHNSRINERMKRLGIKVGHPIELFEQDEIDLVNHINSIVKKNHYQILNFNICKDHVHFLVYCSIDKLEQIVGNIKSVTSRKFKKSRYTNLWAQKFNRRVIENEEQLASVMNYIQYNRAKHNLPDIERLKKSISQMLTPYEKLCKG